MLNLQRLHYKYYEMLIKAPFGSCKSISRKYSIFQKCYFSERKMFSCVWLHFKKCFEKYFLMCGCVIENIIKNTFSTCCTHFLLVAHIFYLLLTFSQLPNEYIISFIPQNTNKTQKKIIKFGHFAQSRLARRRDLGDLDGWSRRLKLQTISTSLALDDLYYLFFLSPSLSFSCSLSLLHVTRKWFEGKMKV